MAELHRFFDSTGGDPREYNAENFAEYFRQFLNSGVYHQNEEPSLEVVHTSGLNVDVDPGSAFLEGYMYRNTDALELIADSGHGDYDRWDRIVLRLDRSVGERVIQAQIINGTPSATPEPPALTRDATVYEISLARILVPQGSGAITELIDERLDEDVCGLVSSLISIPTDVFTGEWAQFMSDTDSAWTVWYDATVDAWDIWFADTIDEWDIWFASVQATVVSEAELDAAIADMVESGDGEGPKRIFVQAAQPTAENEGDLWVVTE